MFTWFISYRTRRGRTEGYAVKSTWVDGKPIRTYLHRHITNAPDDKVVDHINRNTFDNRLSNLRVTNNSHNEQNKPAYGSTGLKGVSYNKFAKKYSASIAKDGKQFHLGYFTDKHDAARMYNFWALDLYGVDAYINTNLE
nr:HNH endonuclease [Sporosarcina sp. ACRSL]